jgi:hypothetical protein
MWFCRYPQEVDSAPISAAGKVWGGSCVSEVVTGFGASFEGILTGGVVLRRLNYYPSSAHWA